MSASRKPSKATDDEIREFLSKTKDAMGKAGMYYDAITKKYKKALKQNGKEKGSGRSLIADKKYLNYVKEVEKRMGEDDANDIRTRQSTATAKGFSKLQKERKLFGKELAGAVVAGVAGQAEAMKDAPEPPVRKTKIRGRGKADKSVEVGDAPAKGKIAQTTLKQRQEKREEMNKDIATGQEENQKKREKLEQEAREALEKRAKSGDLRGARVEENAQNEEEQKDKIVDVVVNHDASIDPLLDHADVEHETDHRKEIPMADAIPVPQKDEPQPSMRGRRKGAEFYNEDAQDIPDASTDIPLPDDTPQNVNMKITEQKQDIADTEVEIEKAVPPTSRGFISPMAEKVSMERNRMKYSGKRLYEECKSFVRIYDDDIKTKSFKKLVDKFESLSAKSSVGELRKLHRDLEEEVIEYYSGRQGLRLGVIIDPSVLGLNIGQLSSAMMPQIPIATSQTIRQVGTQQALQSTKDIHYHLGGRKHALGEQLPEGENVESHTQEVEHRKGRVKIPIAPPNRYLLKRDRRSYLPKNLKIKS